MVGKLSALVLGGGILMLATCGRVEAPGVISDQPVPDDTRTMLWHRQAAHHDTGKIDEKIEDLKRQVNDLRKKVEGEQERVRAVGVAR